MEVEGNIIPWLLYSVKIVMALAVIVAGTSSQGDAWGNARYIVYHIFYGAWVLSTLLFVWLNLELTTRFIRHSLLYVAGIVGVFYFTFRVLKADSTTIPIFTPICFDLGIFLATSFEYAWLGAKDSMEQHFALSSRFFKKHYRSTQVALRTFVMRALGDPEYHPPILPTTYPTTYPDNPDDSQYPRTETPGRNTEESGSDESLLPSEDGHIGELIPPDPNPWAH